ncbi:MAG: creatininase family protein [Desulfobacteraceae bacterium]|jgi:creatinine amidohydrolase/Fe(II)-dependent formamide hydrolase-like protein
MLSKFWIHELTRPAFEDWLKQEEAPVVIIGLGSIEQHGPHLPLGTDSLTAREYIHEVARRSNSVCVHPCFPGYSPHHMDFSGTVTFSEGTLLAVLMDTIGSLSRHGIKHLVIMNVHGGNTNIVNLAAQLAKREFRVMVAAPSGPSDTEMGKLHVDRQKRHWDVHSGVTETGTALHLFPELVEMWRLDDWEATLKMDPKLIEFLDPDKEDHEILSQIFRACVEPDTKNFTESGVYGKNDPREGDPEEARARFEEKVNFMVKFIKVWKRIPIPPAFQD